MPRRPPQLIVLTPPSDGPEQVPMRYQVPESAAERSGRELADSRRGTAARRVVRPQLPNPPRPVEALPSGGRSERRSTPGVPPVPSGSRRRWAGSGRAWRRAGSGYVRCRYLPRNWLSGSPGAAPSCWTVRSPASFKPTWTRLLMILPAAIRACRADHGHCRQEVRTGFAEHLHCGSQDSRGRVGSASHSGRQHRPEPGLQSLNGYSG